MCDDASTSSYRAEKSHFEMLVSYQLLVNYNSCLHNFIDGKKTHHKTTALKLTCSAMPCLAQSIACRVVRPMLSFVRETVSSIPTKVSRAIVASVSMAGSAGKTPDLSSALEFHPACRSWGSITTA